MKIKLQLFFCLCLLINNAFSQTKDSLQSYSLHKETAPIPIELFAGNKAFAFQLIASKQFSPKSKFGFFNVTNFTGDYHTTNQATDFFSQSVITAEVLKGISLTAGLSAIGSSNTPTTVRPTAGLQYLFANKDFVVVILPRFDLTQTYNFETFAVFEYKPTITKTWGVYTRAQGLYNYNTQLGYHEISSINVRLGLSYKNIQFGIGTNLDFYGTGYNSNKNFGTFIKTDLF
ncbi:hypothetical protein [Pedobacter aquatilis]|uniref:hypothetical protein n=1 Tax=Pedobacter aquatilis TaxID=351343 RepID=UPI0029312D81|nr:hypothetical protein [Pedobacter aquatilis]